jgi:hypothetical protein
VRWSNFSKVFGVVVGQCVDAHINGPSVSNVELMALCDDVHYGAVMFSSCLDTSNTLCVYAYVEV